MQTIKGVSSKVLETLKGYGINSTIDYLYAFPKVNFLVDNKDLFIKGELRTCFFEEIAYFKLIDNTIKIKVENIKLQNKLILGKKYCLKISKIIDNLYYIDKIIDNEFYEIEYKINKRIHQNIIEKIINRNNFLIPKGIIDECSVNSLSFYNDVHFPNSKELFLDALKRCLFIELFELFINYIFNNFNIKNQLINNYYNNLTYYYNYLYSSDEKEILKIINNHLLNKDFNVVIELDNTITTTFLNDLPKVDNLIITNDLNSINHEKTSLVVYSKLNLKKLVKKKNYSQLFITDEVFNFLNIVKLKNLIIGNIKIKNTYFNNYLTNSEFLNIVGESLNKSILYLKNKNYKTDLENEIYFKKILNKERWCFNYD